MLTVKGRFIYGVEKDGTWHKDYEMRVPTLEDVERAIEDARAEAGDDASAARIDRHKWAICMVSLGTLKESEITADLLAGLASTEFRGLGETEAELQKKLAGASGSCAPSA